MEGKKLFNLGGFQNINSFCNSTNNTNNNLDFLGEIDILTSKFDDFKPCTVRILHFLMIITIVQLF